MLFVGQKKLEIARVNSVALKDILYFEIVNQ